MIYENKVYALTRSITFKSIWSAFRMNTALTDAGMPIPDDKQKWRYFMHLAGDVHELDEDLLIVSLDTNQLVALNSETLKTHKKTATFYKDRDNREKLHEEFPFYTLFIDGLYDPIPYEVSIAAEDGTVLRYDSSLIEPQEHSLIFEIENWIKAEHHLYLMESWAAIYPLYITWFIGKIYSHLPGKIIELRLRKLHTIETHSNYIREFLRSHKRLDKYLPYLTLKQMMFLYRNIRYIERNAGRQDTFEFLIENLLTERAIPVDGYNLTELYTDMQNGGIDRIPVGFKTPLNFQERSLGRDVEIYGMDLLIDKEINEGALHERLLDEYREDAHKSVKRSKVLASPTKLIEVTGTDPNSIRNESFLDRLVYDWCYLSSMGMYNGLIDLIDPQSGNNIRLSSLEAFCVFIYAYYKGYHETEVNRIPPFNCSEQEDGTWFTANDYKPGLITRAELHRDSIINYFVETHVSIPTPITDRTTMYNNSYERWIAKGKREHYVGSMRTDDMRADAEYIYRFNYRERFIEHEFTGMPYRDFMYERGFQVDNYSPSIWKDLCTDLLKLTVDYDPEAAIGFSEIQENLVQLFLRLSSYTIQVVNKYGSSDEVTMEPVGALVQYIDVEEEAATEMIYESSAHLVDVKEEGTVEAKAIGMDAISMEEADIQTIYAVQDSGAVPYLEETITLAINYESSATIEYVGNTN